MYPLAPVARSAARTLFTGAVLLSLLASLSGCAPSVPLHASSPEPVVVARFILDVEGLEADFPDQGGGLLPTAVRVVQDAQTAAQAANTLTHPEGSALKATIDSTYTIVADRLARDLGVRLLPLETLQGEVPYLVGTPLGRADDVVATGRYERALDVEIYVDVPDAEQGSFSFLGTGKVRVSGHPEMTLSVRLVDADGDVAWRDDVRVRSREKVTLDERWLLGFRTEQQVSDHNTLPQLTRQALDALVRRQKT